MPTDDEHGPYAGLVEADEDSRWAFGGGFADPLAGMDASVPPGVDGRALAAYCLELGDDALVLAQRLAQWCTRAPELEEEVALANVGLDLLGQVRLLYARAAAADAGCVPVLPEDSPVPAEDRLAFFRDADAFRCSDLALLPNGDFAVSVLRLAVFAAQRLALLDLLRASADPVLAGIAGKAVKELQYHRDYAARWVLTLAGGTPESRRRMTAAVEQVWPVVGPAEIPDPGLLAGGVAADPMAARSAADEWLGRLLAEATLEPPAQPPAAETGHDLLVEVLAELQGLARAHPRGRW